MKRLLIGTTLGIAAAFAMGACGSDKADDVLYGDDVVLHTEDRQEVIDNTWAQFSGQICPPYREALATGLEIGMTEEDVIDLVMNRANVQDPEIEAIIEDLIRTRC